jgi:dethiobiotin synthetase
MIYFITAIDTNCGKTLVSAILTQALGAAYWKPIQSGLPADTDTVKSLVNHPNAKFHTEAYRFTQALSPHAAAAYENIAINVDDIQLPVFEKDLVIEGAGGVLVPLNSTHFVIDLASKFEAEVILVSDIYLGSINHTLLTIHELRRRNLSIKGIVFNHAGNEATESIILSHAACPCLLRIEKENYINQETIIKYAERFKI